jgi:hypothetical protein
MARWDESSQSSRASSPIGRSDRTRATLAPRGFADVGTSLFLNALHLVRRSLAMLPRLIDDCRGQQLRGIKFAHGETIEPCLLSAREAMQLRAPDVPEFDVDPVRPTLAEEQNGHGESLERQAKKRQIQTDSA